MRERSERANGRSKRVATARLGLRLARRELRRRPWRTALVLLMVLIPSAAMTTVVTYVRTTEWSAADATRANYGRADATAILRAGAGVETDAQVEELRLALPAGSSMLVERTLYDRVHLDRERAYLRVSDLPLDDRMVEGRYTDLGGRLPRTGAEVVVTIPLADDLGLERGDRFAPERLGRSLTVVGTVRPLADNESVAFVLPDGIPPDEASEVIAWLDLTSTQADLDEIGPWEIVPPYVDQSETATGLFWSYVGGGVGLVVLGTVITAAFAVGARRQLRSIGLLYASGASPSTVRWFLVAQGALAGLLGSLLGILTAVALTRRTPQQLLDSLAGRPVEGVATRATDLVPIVVIGVVVASVAAWLPARSTARIPTLQALAGRRPLPLVPKRLPLLGALTVGAGCALLAMAVAGARDGGSSLWALVAVTGALAVLLGSIAVAPYAVAGMERASARLPNAWRLAGRSMARSRVRSSAVVGAICAVATAVVAIGTLATSTQPAGAELPQIGDDQLMVERSPYPWPSPGSTDPYVASPIPDDVRRRIQRIVGDARWVPLLDLVAFDQADRAAAPGATAITPGAAGTDVVDGTWQGLTEATPEVLNLFEVPEHLRAALRRGKAVAVSGDVPDDRPVEVYLPPEVSLVAVADPQQLAIGGTFDSPAAADALPKVLVSPATVRRLGLVSRPSTRTLVVLPDATTQEQRDAFQLLSEDLTWELGSQPPQEPEWAMSLYWDHPLKSPSAALVKAGLLGLSLALVLAVVTVGLALAATDSEDERQVLAAVGAPPATLRRVAALRGVLLVLIAVLISVPAGLVSAASIVAASASDGTFRIDGWGLLFIVVLLPTAVGLTLWVGGRARDALRPARADVFAWGD